MACKSKEYTREGVYHFISAALVCAAILLLIVYAVPVEIAYWNLTTREPQKIKDMHYNVLMIAGGVGVALSAMVGMHKYLKGKRKCSTCTKCTTTVELVSNHPTVNVSPSQAPARVATNVAQDQADASGSTIS